MSDARASETTRRLIVLGATGSIGRQTVEVVEHLNGVRKRAGKPDAFRVVGLAGGKNEREALEIARRLGVQRLAMHCGEGVEEVGGVRVERGSQAAERLVREVDCDVVLAAIVGSAGLPATLAAVELGRDVALANKETLVAAGGIVVPAARASGSRLLPVDSEHSAIWQCLWGRESEACPPCEVGREVKRVTLTASGGPFRTASREETYHATAEKALKHPTWTMGAKVTVDSASLTNKALELIEAHWLFGLESARLDAVVHPQSIVHSFVEFADGSVLAQLGAPDMRTPIQIALTYPERPAGCSKTLDLTTMSRLDFEPVDHERFPALRLGLRVIDEGGSAGAVLNGANEVGVEAFLSGAIPFGRITELASEAMDRISWRATPTLESVMEADEEARQFVRAALGDGKVRVRGVGAGSARVGDR
ncbi:MAG: 1-deoxy-D-xylulose-5-phosphate reductoisomerase [Phycisphaerales bacterium]